MSVCYTRLMTRKKAKQKHDLEKITEKYDENTSQPAFTQKINRSSIPYKEVEKILDVLVKREKDHTAFILCDLSLIFHM
ncbi:hypothetical protein EV214_1257 [Marinisporobacter balticus]|uniref:Uncharacterized protein n=1 Tax=Marinisporobacter balticus TaxID=2018667 RepID=A0A4R2KEK6_9FIRM|nr:hypothetical protein EV214_1257 [Marinisporobacter balticus]